VVQIYSNFRYSDNIEEPKRRLNGAERWLFDENGLTYDDEFEQLGGLNVLTAVDDPEGSLAVVDDGRNGRCY
jgi:hypothetical protein